MKINNFLRTIVILAVSLLAPMGVAHADPNQGPGGPILVITNGTANFGKFYAEILRTEGFNEFAVAEIGAVTATTLNSYDVVILAKTAVTASQATMLSDWVTAGGNLILMDPAPQLASLAGITQTAGTLSNAYLLVDPTTRVGAAISNETLQFHGTAQLSTLSGATSIATLYSSAASPTVYPAVTLRSVGASGGQVATFMFDLATSVVYTRQGNPAWATQERDGIAPRRSSDKFFGNSASDPQPDWVDLTKVAIPQADEQQRFLANLITDMNADRKALPRFWYFPHGNRAAVVMTGDDHGFFYGPGGATQARFNQYLDASAPGCSVADWECVRGTSYIFTDSALTDAQAAAFESQGFEVGLHVASWVDGNCIDYTLASLTDIYNEQKLAFFNKFTSVSPLSTERHHCIVWSDWASGAKVQFANGIRLDTSYYFWPSSWVQNTPGHFTGSAMPMRFADLDGTLIDVYQTVTQLTDESGQEFPYTVDTLLDRALGAGEQYGVYTVNAHIDQANEIESSSTVESAQLRGVPVISARQLLTWLDGRNASTFAGLSRVGNTLNFSVAKASAARGLQGMLPWRSGGQLVTTLQRNGTDVPYEISTIKGIEYAMFDAESGSYTATYTADTTPPTLVTRTPTAGATNVQITTPIRGTFSEMLDASTVTSATVELRNAANALIPATIGYSSGSQSVRITPASVLQYSTTYTVTIRGGSSDPRVKDPAGNALAANQTWSFTTAAAPNCPCTIWSDTATPAVASDTDTGAVELGVKFRSDVSGYIKGIRFYKGPGNTGVHTGTLWNAAGAPLATATFFGETSGGWQQVLFTTPVAITANTTYIASYYAPNGGYSVTSGQFASTGVDNGILHALSSPASSGNGVYAYGTGGTVPSNSWQGANYWVDVVFDTVGGSPSDSVAPTATITSPVNATNYDATSTPLSLGGTSNDNIGVTQVTWANDRGGSGVATGTAVWSISGISLESGTNVITVTARDAAGNVGTDTLFVNFTPAPDSTPPSISARTPAISATNVGLGSTVSVTFNEAMSASTINGNTIELRNAANAVVPASVTYNATSFVATLTPSSWLSPNSTYTVTVRGGATDPRVKDSAGNALAANAVWSFTTTASSTISIWPSSTTPAVASEADTSSVELGVKFRSDIAGYITGIRFYKGAANTGVHTGTLWSSTGQVLGSATFIDETATGWQQVNFASPVQIAANTTYVASYFAPNGGYSVNGSYFSSSGTDNGVLHALSNAAAGGNGVYIYGTGGTFPNQTFESANYWVDVAFTANIGPDTSPPTITGRTPSSGAINVATNSPVTVTFSEALDSSTVNASSIELRNAGNTLVPSTVSLNGLVATLAPSAALANSSTYTVTVRGGGTDPRVKDAAGNALAASSSWSFTTAAPGGPCAANAITAENCLAGNPASEWDVSGAGDPTIQGFATQISVNRGSTIQFKVQTNATNYRLDIYRMGYYGGMGARKITTVNPSATLPQSQPSCLTQASTGLIDCGNWAVSASWPVPANMTSGIYFAKLVRADTGGSSHIVFIVRDDSAAADIVFQTSDTTWQAYNTYGGNSLYVGSPGTNPSRAYKVSYNRPFNTRGNDGGQDWVFNAEYPMIRWLESNGYNVTYISGVDSDRSASLLTSRRSFISVGHDEYWSGQQRANVEAARNAGVHMAFFSGNEVFWKTRWENSIDGSNTSYRTLVSYKETHAGAKIDPSSEWTGTWRDPRFSPPSNGGRPENSLTGTVFTVNSGTAAILVPEQEGKMRLWRGTNIASLGTNQVANLPNGTLGYEWDSDVDNGSRPAGLVRMSDTTVNNVDKLQDFGSTYASDTANHAITFYKHSSGARVFGLGTVQWTWGLDANHDRAGTPTDQRMQQATVNLFADMNVQPANLQAPLSVATATTDTTAPTSTITAPAAGANLPQSATVITGTAADVGGAVGAIEVSVDGGTTWHPATGRTAWSYTWNPATTGAVTISVRAVDDSGNIQGTPTTRSVTIAQATCPCSIWPSTTPNTAPDSDPGSIELGTRFRSSSNGRITALRFYKDPQNTGTHVGTLWSSTGTQLAQVTFTGETASGWQTQALPTPVNITANTDYVVSYHTNSGFYTGQDNYFNSAATSGPLRAPANGEGGANGLYKYSSSSTFPTDTYSAENYWVDVVFNYASGDVTPPTVSITTPTANPTLSVTSSPLSLGGTASDAVGVTQVTWANNRGGSGTASGTTSWTISGITLQSGDNIVTVTARDAAGNTSADSITVTYTPPDTTPPVVSFTSPTSNATTTVNTTPLNIGGTASDAVGVTQVTWANDRGGSGTATGTTSWSVTGVVLQTGQNVLTVTARDAAGNTSSDTLTVTYTPDTTAPVVTITAPTSNATTTVQTSSINLGGSSSDAVGVTQVTWVNDRGGSGTASGTTSWSVAGVALQTGQNVLTVTARDAAGNTGTDTLTVTYNPDTTPPAVTITSPTSNTTITVQATPMSIGGTASDAVGVTQVTWANNRGGSGTASGTTNWSATGIVLQSGQNILTVTARDAAGNTNTDTLTVTYNPDVTAPAISFATPTSNSTFATSLATLNIGGNASDAVGVTQVTWSNNRGGTGTASGTTTWSAANITLQSGDNILTVSARDAAGNIGTDTLTVTYTPDTTAPVVTITGPTTNSTVTVTSTPLALSGTASDAVGVTQVSWSNNRGGSGNASGTSNWSVGSITLQSGSNIITVTARDAAGNTSTDTLTVTYNPDTTQPLVTITTPTANSTLTVTATPLSIGGTASDNIAVTQVTWSNNRGGSGTATGTTNWTVSGVTLQSGSNIITVTARDAAGNTRTDSLTVTYNPPDTTQPNVTILTPTSNATLTTSASSTTMSGTASDNVGVTQVTWANNRGGSGTASGTTLWTTSTITLQTGQNILTVTARDAAGNTRTDQLTITRN